MNWSCVLSRRDRENQSPQQHCWSPATNHHRPHLPQTSDISEVWINSNNMSFIQPENYIAPNYRRKSSQHISFGMGRSQLGRPSFAVDGANWYLCLLYSNYNTNFLKKINKNLLLGDLYLSHISYYARWIISFFLFDYLSVSREKENTV